MTLIFFVLRAPAYPMRKEKSFLPLYRELRRLPHPSLARWRLSMAAMGPKELPTTFSTGWPRRSKRREQHATHRVPLLCRTALVHSTTSQAAIIQFPVRPDIRRAIIRLPRDTTSHLVSVR